MTCMVKVAFHNGAEDLAENDCDQIGVLDQPGHGLKQLPIFPCVSQPWN